MEVPLSLQPPAVKVKVVEVPLERIRQRRTRAYPAGVAREAVLMQYAIDTQLDKALNAAFEDICTAHVVTGNPMHALLLRLKSASQYFELWRETDAEMHLAALKAPSFVDLHIYTQPSRSSEANEASSIFGVKPSLQLVDHQILHGLRKLLVDFIPTRANTRVQRYDCDTHVAFCGESLCFNADVKHLHSVHLREDHFITGPSEQEAVAIHCQHVAQAILRLHHKTQHIVSGVTIGSAMRPIHELLANAREITSAFIHALQEAKEISLHAFALVQPESGDARYVQVIKSYHLCHMVPQGAAVRGIRCWPERVTQIFDSIFLSRAHAALCFEVARTSGDPLLDWRAGRWRDQLLHEATDFIGDGQLVAGCQSLLLQSIMEDLHDPIVPACARLLQSGAARLHRLAQLCRTIQLVLSCSEDETQRDKCNQQVLVSMFHLYRTTAAEFLSSDTCCNFEPIQSTVQEAFYAVLTDLRQQSVLTREATQVLETVDDYMTCVQLAVASQVIDNDAPLRALVHSARIR